nr:MAG TPA: hypothetical protein [Caudoviricetes sp.]
MAMGPHGWSGRGLRPTRTWCRCPRRIPWRRHA